MAAKTVTYRGPVDPVDPTTEYRVPGKPGEPDAVFPLNEPVDDVPAAVLSVLNDAEGHQFDTGAAARKVAAAGEPFAEYDSLTAELVVKGLGDPRLVPNADAARAVLAYEKAHEDRKTVVEAAEHQVEAFEPESASGETG